MIISCANILADFGESTNRSIIQNSICIKNNELNSYYYIFFKSKFLTQSLESQTFVDN